MKRLKPLHGLELKTPPPIGLPDRFAIFCRTYVIERNAGKAAVAAGYSQKGAHATANRIRNGVKYGEKIRAYIAALELEAAGGGESSLPPGDYSPEWVRRRYAAIARVSPADLLIGDGSGGYRWKLPEELNEAERAAVCEILLEKPPKLERQKNQDKAPDVLLDPLPRVAGYKLHSSKDALDALARVQGMNKATVEHGGSVDIRALFRVADQSPERSETSARLRAQHGNAGARIIDVTPDQRAVTRLRGV